MSERIYLEAKKVAGSLYGHLYLVKRDDLNPDDAEVIRGGPTGSFFNPGPLITETMLLRNSTDAYDGGPRFSIDIGDAGIWDSLVSIADGLSGLYNYRAFGNSQDSGAYITNSNATILTVLNSVGVDVRSLIGQLGDFGNGYPGVSYAQNHYGTLLGSGDNPWIVASAAMDDQGLTLYGRRDFDDKMIGTDQDDYFFGNSGNDEVFWGKGNDVYLGGDGKDTYNLEQSSNPVNLTIGYSAGHEAFGLTLAAHIEANIIAGKYSTYTHEVERFVLSGGDDTVSFVGDLNAYSEVSNLSDIEIQAGPQEENGDTLDLQGITSPGDINISLTDTAGTITQGNTAIGNLFGFENVIGTDFDDFITGNSGTNILYGGGGADSLWGGAGDDILIFDADDSLVDGGAGRDVGIVSGGAGVTVDLATTGLEVVIGGAGNDTFALNGQGDTIQMVAGGGGVDTFNIHRTTDGGPIVVWGGEGADVFNIYDTNKTGILTVNVEGLTVENFADFDLDMLNLGNDFAWDAIDLVVLNPDSEDRFFSSYESDTHHPLGAGGQKWIPVSTYSYSGPNSEGTYLLLGDVSVDALSVYDASFLGGGVTSVQTVTQTYRFRGSAGYIDYIDDWSSVHLYFIDTDESHEYTAENASFEYEQTSYTFNEVDGYNEGKTISYFWAGAKDVSVIDALYQNLDPYDPNIHDFRTYHDDYKKLSFGWFVAGGTFDNLDLSTNGTISGTMPGTETGFSVTDWLASVTGDDTGTGGGGGTGANSNTTNASSGSGTTPVSTFSPETSFIIFDGTAIDPTSSTGGYTVTQAGANVQVDFGGGDVVILENVTLTEWQAAAARQHFGSAAGETLTGTSQDEAFVSGAGDDSIIAGSGDDTINYVSGDDVIKGHKSNYGDDTLDLSQYTAEQVSFRIVEHDVFIDTPDGTIELDYQARYEVGHTRTNIENIIFSDGTLDDAGIRNRAIADQTSAGDDIVTGSYVSDTISSGAGNDTIYASSGDDTIIYSSGDDVIVGTSTINYGNDTLDLSQYAADQVSFRIVGHDVFIDTPDGNIELDYQVRNELGHVRSNIENIVFSDGTLDEAGIRNRAIADQTSAGDDVVTGSYVSDTISSGAGHDMVNAWYGDDTIVYTSGNDVINGHGSFTNYGNDTLDMSKYTADQVSFSIVGHDVFIDTPDGTIELDYQVRNEVGHTRSNIENIIFSDGTLDEVGIADRAIADQASIGDDVITGSFQDEIITGGAGTDTLSGVSGSDTFVFAVGDGVDVITDYDAANDALEFTGLGFSDLTITQTGSDVLIEYGTGDQLTVTGSLVANFVVDEFVFT